MDLQQPIAINNIITEHGGTIAIGGIVKSNKTYSVEGFSILSKLPVVGWLFKSKVV